MLVELATCKVDDITSSADSVIDVFEKFQMRQEDHILKPEFEWAIVINILHVRRIHPFSVQDKLPTSKANRSIGLHSRKPVRLMDLQWGCHDIEPL